MKPIMGLWNIRAVGSCRLPVIRSAPIIQGLKHWLAAVAA